MQTFLFHFYNKHGKMIYSFLHFSLEQIERCRSERKIMKRRERAFHLLRLKLIYLE